MGRESRAKGKWAVCTVPRGQWAVGTVHGAKETSTALSGSKGVGALVSAAMSLHACCTAQPPRPALWLPCSMQHIDSGSSLALNIEGGMLAPCCSRTR